MALIFGGQVLYFRLGILIINEVNTIFQNLKTQNLKHFPYHTFQIGDIHRVDKEDQEGQVLRMVLSTEGYTCGTSDQVPGNQSSSPNARAEVDAP